MLSNGINSPLPPPPPQLHARLKVEEFVQLYACVCSFCAAADGFTDTSGAAASVASATVLRAEVNTQAKDFLHTLHSRHVEALGRLLDAEQWKQADVRACLVCGVIARVCLIDLVSGVRACVCS